MGFGLLGFGEVGCLLGSFFWLGYFKFFRFLEVYFWGMCWGLCFFYVRFFGRGWDFGFFWVGNFWFFGRGCIEDFKDGG